MDKLRSLISQFVKFGVVGFIAFLIDYGLLFACTEFLGFPYLVSATIGFCVSVIFNYFASMRYVFTSKEGMSRGKEMTIFIVLSFIGLLLNDGLMWVGVDGLGWNYMLVKIGATAMVTIYNFITRKIFLDAGDAHVPETTDSEAS